MRNRRAPTAKLGVVGRPVKGELISPRDPGPIDDRAVEHNGLHHSDKVLHGSAADVQLAQILKGHFGQLVRICRAFGQFRPSLCLAQRKDLKLFLVVMEAEFEALGQQLPHQALNLTGAGFACAAKFCVDVEFVFVHPGRRADELLGMDLVSICDEVAQRRVHGQQAVFLNVESFARHILARLDVGSHNAGIKAGRHRRAPFGNLPGRLGRCAVQD